MQIIDSVNNSFPHKLARGLPWSLILLLIFSIAVVGVFWFSKSRQKGETYISLQAKAEAQSTGKDPCDILGEWLAVAKQVSNKPKIRAIQQAQKFLGCRNIQKRSQGGISLMSWYAAHAIMYVKFRDNNQNKYPFWENVYLIEAESDKEACNKTTARAKEEEEDSNGTFTWEGRPATWCFAGIRKLITCEDTTEKPGDGTEVTYLEMEVDSKENFQKLLNGEVVAVTYG